MRYFKPVNTVDNWGDPKKINHELLLRLDDFRHTIGCPFIITSGTGGNHLPNSQHYLGNAVDGIAIGFKGSLLDLYFMAELFNFTGIGLYPDWQHKGKVIGGLHLDMRPLQKQEDGTFDYRSNRWLGINKTTKTKSGKTKTELKYYAFDLKNLKKYKIC